MTPTSFLKETCLLSGVLAAGGMGGSAYFQTTESGHDDSRGADDNHYPWNHHTDDVLCEREPLHLHASVDDKPTTTLITPIDLLHTFVETYKEHIVI